MASKYLYKNTISLEYVHSINKITKKKIHFIQTPREDLETVVQCILWFIKLEMIYG